MTRHFAELFLFVNHFGRVIRKAPLDNALFRKRCEQVLLDFGAVEITAVDIVLVAHVDLAHAATEIAHLTRSALLVGLDAAVGDGEKVPAREDVRNRLARQVAELDCAQGIIGRMPPRSLAAHGIVSTGWRRSLSSPQR